MKKYSATYWAAKKKKEDHLHSLVAKALNKYTAEELFAALYEESDNDQQEDIREEMKSILTSNGGIFIDVPELDKRTKVEDFLCSEIFPYHSDQQSQMFL